MFGHIAFVRYVGDRKDTTVPDPWNSGETLKVGNGKPFPVPRSMIIWFEDTKLFKQVKISPEAVQKAIQQAANMSTRNISDRLGSTYVRRRVLFIAPDEGGYQGARYHAYQIALSLANIGCYVQYVSNKVPDFFKDFKASPNLTFEIQEDLNTSFVGFDLIVASPPQSFPIAIDYCEREDIPLWTICFEPDHVLEKAVPEAKESLDDNTSKMAYRLSEKILANSDLTKKQVVEGYGISADKILVIEPAINITEIDNAEVIPGNKSENKSIVYIGRAANFKGLYDAIDIIRFHDQDLPPFTFKVISREANHVKKAKGEGTTEHPIKYYENVSDLGKFQIIKQSCGGIQLSKHEGFGMVPAEFLICGKPVICKPIEQIKVEYGDDVIYADKEEEIVAGIKNLLNGATVDPKVSKRLRGRLTIETMERSLDSLLGSNKCDFEIHSLTKPRVLYFLHKAIDPPFGGAEKTFRHHLLMLDAMGFECHAVYFRDRVNPKDKKTTKDGNLWIHRLPDTEWRFSATKKLFKQIAVGVKPFYIASYGPESTAIAYQVATELGIPHVMSLNFWNAITTSLVDPMESKPKDMISEGVEAAKGSAVVIANSTYTADVVKKLSGREAIVINPPVLADEIKVENRTPSHIVIGVLEVGDVRNLVTEIAKALPREKFILCKLRGKDALDNHLLASPNIEFMDGVDDMREIYSKAKIVLIPSPVAHSFCRTGLESMINGIPVVASAKGNLTRLFGDAGILLENESIPAWVDAIKKLLNDKKHYSKMSEAGIEKAKEFSYEIQRGRLEEMAKGLYNDSKTDIQFFSMNFPGVRTALRHLEKFVPDSKFIGDSLPSAKHVVLGGWTNAYMDNLEYDNVDVHFNSSIAQTDLSNEAGLLMEVMGLLSREKIKRMLLTDEHTANAMKEVFGAKIDWCPDCFDMEELDGIERDPIADGFHVSMFFTAHHRKNVLTQMLAAKLAGATVHGSSLFNNDVYSKFASMLGLDFKVERLPDRLDYLRFMAKMHVGLQVTFTESFNYAAFEHMAMGIPVIGVPFTPCMDFKSKELRRWLLVENIGNPMEIRDKLLRIKTEGFPDALRNEMMLHVKGVCEKHASIARKVFGR